MRPLARKPRIERDRASGLWVVAVEWQAVLPGQCNVPFEMRFREWRVALQVANSYASPPR